MKMNPGILPLFKACGECKWLPCWLSRGQQVSVRKHAGIHPGFETQGRCYQKFKTKDLCSPKICSKEKGKENQHDDVSDQHFNVSQKYMTSYSNYSILLWFGENKFHQKFSWCVIMTLREPWKLNFKLIKKFNFTRKSSCMNTRGIPPTA